jgi:hypothetical protein
MGYFAGRAAPLGPVGPAPVTAMFYGFAPTMVARALPDAWSYASPAAVLDARVRSAGAALRSRLDDADRERVDELHERLSAAVAACRFDGRPLAAAWTAVPAPPDPVTCLWLLATVLREHRGDGHVLASVAAGLQGLDATVTLVGTGAITRDGVQPHRGWTDDDWDESVRRLRDGGLVDESGRLTASGASLRREVEEATDRLAAAPVDLLGEHGVERVIELAVPISRRLVDAGAVPVPNPMGAPRP